MKPHFRLFGVPVHISATFLIVLAVLGLTGSGFDLIAVALWVVIAGVAILVHEFGHAGMFKVFGHKPAVQLYGMGGLTSSLNGPPLSPGKDLLVSLAGPAAGFALGGLGLLLPQTASEYPYLARNYLLFATFGFGVLNLMPVLPLDGGHALVSLLRVVRIPKAELVGHVVSIGVCAGAVLWMLTRDGRPSTTVPLLALWFGAMNVRSLMDLRKTDPADQLEAAQAALNEGDPVRARELIRPLANRSGPAQGIAGELLAWSELAAGNVPGARGALQRRPIADGPALAVEAAVAQAEGAGPAALGPLAAGLAEERWIPPKVLMTHLQRTGTTRALVDQLEAMDPGTGTTGLHHLQVLAHAAGNDHIAIDIANRAWKRQPDPRVGLVAARSMMTMGHAADALEWLTRLADLGVEGLGEAVDDDEVLRPLRTIPAFTSLRARMR